MQLIVLYASFVDIPILSIILPDYYLIQQRTVLKNANAHQEHYKGLNCFSKQCSVAELLTFSVQVNLCIRRQKQDNISPSQFPSVISTDSAALQISDGS